MRTASLISTLMVRDLHHTSLFLSLSRPPHTFSICGICPLPRVTLPPPPSVATVTLSCLLCSDVPSGFKRQVPARRCRWYVLLPAYVSSFYSALYTFQVTIPLNFGGSIAVSSRHTPLFLRIWVFPTPVCGCFVQHCLYPPHLPLYPRHCKRHRQYICLESLDRSAQELKIKNLPLFLLLELDVPAYQ